MPPENLASTLSAAVHYHPHTNLTDLLSEARSCGVTVFDIDCSRARTQSAILKTIAHVMDFDDRFEGGLESLYEHLTDAVFETPTDMLIVLRNLHEDGAPLRATELIDTLDEVVEYAREHGHALSVVIEEAEPGS